MGVDAAPLTLTPAGNAPSGASRALVEIGRMDGLYMVVDDPCGMAVAHGIISGIGGMRATGDLVARVQVAEDMRIEQAKRYVASKPGVSVEEISDPVVMNEWREGLDLGRVNVIPGAARGIDAKLCIAELLDIESNCVKKFRERTELEA